MEITNICPYCGGEMREGALPAYKYALTWCPRNEQGGIVEGEPVRLSGMPVIESVYAPARYCESCRVVIVPVPEIESFADKAGKWLDKRLARRPDRPRGGAPRGGEGRAGERRKTEQGPVGGIA